MAFARTRRVAGVLLLGLALRAGAAAADPPSPAPADPAVVARVGEYGGLTADAPSYTVYERDGQLRLRRNDGPAPTDSPVPPPETLFVLESGHVSGLRINGQVIARTDLGAARVARIRAGVHRPDSGVPSDLNPPREPPPRRAADLVDLMTLDPGLKFDIRYAGPDNFMGFPLYERPAAFLQRPAAEALVRANRALKPLGYGLMIHDGYRPWRVTKLFWDATPDEAHIFVADPAKGSRHNRGCAVDLTLYDLQTDQAVEMTSRYDEMSPRAFADYPGGTSLQRWRRDLLRRVMEAEGFTVYPEEWWHFDFGAWADYAIGTASFTELRPSADSAERPH
jgi:D-alanyl-D-alanine dipeptidase